MKMFVKLSRIDRIVGDSAKFIISEKRGRAGFGPDEETKEKYLI
jgi:hypothetical protein